jgi:hypothetical protein
MSEKATIKAPATQAEVVRGAQLGRGSKGRAAGKLIVVAAAAWFVYYGIPQGQLNQT